MASPVGSFTKFRKTDSLQETFERGTMIKKEKTWVRFAANGPSIKAGKRFGWRCCLSESRGGEASGEIPLSNWQLTGTVTPQNMMLGTKVEGDPCLMGVVGWIDMFGDVTIEDDVLKVDLQQP